MQVFKRISAHELTDRPIGMIAKDWMLVTASKPDGSSNCMTASWGGLGELWGKPVAFLFIRPQRYTHEFTEAGDTVTLTWFSDDMRDKLAFCGAKSGRDVDKVAECGLTAVTDGDGAIYYSEARRVMKLKKLYAQRIAPECSFDSELLDFHYPQKDYHTMYVCEILEILENVTEETPVE